MLLRGCCGMIQGNEFPGIAELVPRHIWDVEIVRSSRTTRTKVNAHFRCRRLNAYGISGFRGF